MIELKPCPFCGSADLNMYWDLGVETYITQCRGCWAEIKQYEGVKDKAINAWNRRAGE